jgi:hypothetical protein
MVNAFSKYQIRYTNYLYIVVLYNVTVKVNRAAEKEWLDYMQSKHIPDVMATGHFSSYRLSRLLDQPDDDDPTYIVQYECPSLHKLNHYQIHNAKALQDEHSNKFKDRFVAFRTVMEVVQNQ